MDEYIENFKRLGADDFVNSETFNATIQQIQHNINLLYRSQASSVQNWNISELLYGNLLDYDQVGEKRYVNGGKLDSLEKVLPFNSTTGDIIFEETEILNNKEWLRWSIGQGARNNVKLIRNIVVPETLRHQKVLVGFKFIPFVGNDVKTNERYEIYINGNFAGTGETDIITVNGEPTPKTIYGVYDLTGSETNLEVALVRSTVNGPVLDNYSVRVSNVFMGLHTLGNSSFAMNYPASGSSFTGASADINSFYDFDNNSVRPIPAFLINSDTLDGGSSSTINITSSLEMPQTEFWVAPDSSGTGLGYDADNAMEADTFFNVQHFSNNVTVHLLGDTSDYGDMTFDKGNYEVYLSNTYSNLTITNMNVSKNASVAVKLDPMSVTNVTVKNINMDENASLKFSNESSNKVNFSNETINMDEYSVLSIDAGTFTQPLSSVTNPLNIKNSQLIINLLEPTFNNASGPSGFGMLTGPISQNSNSSVSINTTNSDLHFHIGGASTNESISVSKQSNLSVKGFNQVSTSAISKKIKSSINSNVEIECPVQADGGATSFVTAEANLQSSIGVNISGGSLNVIEQNFSTVYNF